MIAEDTVMKHLECCKATFPVTPPFTDYERIAQAQAKITWPLAVEEEQKRMTEALRVLHKLGWTLSDVIQMEDTMGT